MKKKIIIVIGIIIAAGLLSLLWIIRESDHRRKQLEAAWEKERLPYNVQMQQLKNELENLETLYQSDKKPRANIQFAFTGLDKKVYNECYPLLEESKFTAVLVVSSTQFPGMKGCITKEQFKKLIDAGWSVCIEWDVKNPVDTWWPSLKDELNKLGVIEINTMYFPSDTYNAQLDGTLLELGFTTAVCQRNETENPLQTSYEEGVWHVGAIGFMSSKPKAWLEQALGLDANLTYLVGFQQEDELYSKEHFDAMLDICKDFSDSGDLAVSDMEDARVHYSNRAEEVDPEQEEEYQKKKQALKTKLAEVEEKLREIDARY